MNDKLCENRFNLSSCLYRDVQEKNFICGTIGNYLFYCIENPNFHFDIVDGTLDDFEILVKISQKFRLWKISVLFDFDGELMKISSTIVLIFKSGANSVRFKVISAE
jgi:hypothetical protein